MDKVHTVHLVVSIYVPTNVVRNREISNSGRSRNTSQAFAGPIFRLTVNLVDRGTCRGICDTLKLTCMILIWFRLWPSIRDESCFSYLKAGYVAGGPGLGWTHIPYIMHTIYSACRLESNTSLSPVSRPLALITVLFMLKPLAQSLLCPEPSKGGV